MVQDLFRILKLEVYLARRSGGAPYSLRSATLDRYGSRDRSAPFFCRGLPVAHASRQARAPAGERQPQRASLLPRASTRGGLPCAAACPRGTGKRFRACSGLAC